MKKFLLYAFGCFYLPFVWHGKVYAHHLSSPEPIASQMVSMNDPFDPYPGWYVLEQYDNDLWSPCHTFEFQW